MQKEINIEPFESLLMEEVQDDLPFEWIEHHKNGQKPKRRSTLPPLVDVDRAVFYCEYWHLAFALVQNRSWHIALVSPNRVRNCHGVLVGTTGIARDISKRIFVRAFMGLTLEMVIFICTARND